MVKRIAEVRGGGVGVRSGPGRGSGFWITLKADAVAEQAEREAVGLGRRILIVDDLPVSRQSLAGKLRLARFDAVSVGGVDEGLEQLAKDPDFDLVLADEVMPVKGGLDLLAALRADPRHAALPFILLSLFGAEHDPAERTHHPDAVGLKPIRACTLTALATQVLTGKVPSKAELPPAPKANPTCFG